MVLWSPRLLPDGAHGLGQRRTVERRPGRPLPTLDFAGGTVVHVTRVFLRWSARCIWASARLSQETMPPHSVVLSFIGACCSGSAGSASTPAAPWAPAVWRPALLSQPTSPRPLRRHWWVAAEWCAMASPAPLGAISGAVAGLVAITPAAVLLRHVRSHRRNRRIFCYLTVASESALQLRRFARRFRHSWRRRNTGRAAHRRVRQPAP